MTKYAYVGDPNDDFSGPSTLKVRGREFKKGEFVDVSETVATVLAGHSHFQAEGDGDAKAGVTAAARALEPDALRDLLDNRGVEYAKNANRNKLADLLVESGWTPGTGAEEQS